MPLRAVPTNSQVFLRGVLNMRKKQLNILVKTNRKWFSVVCTLIDNDIRHHSGESATFSPL